MRLVHQILHKKILHIKQPLNEPTFLYVKTINYLKHERTSNAIWNFALSYLRHIQISNALFQLARKVTHWLRARSAADPAPESWCRLSLCTMPISFIQALFFPPGPPIPLCHIVILTGLHHKLLLQQKHRYLHLWYLTAKKNNKKKQQTRKNTLHLHYNLFN